MLSSSSEQQADQEVDRLFTENPPVHGEYCRNPVTGASYVGGLDPTKRQKDDARRALLAREWFRTHGPADAQPLPVGDERDGVHAITLLPYIVCLYARSLEGRGYDCNEHPPFADYVSGALWEAELAEGGFVSLPSYPLEELQELTKRYPPRMLMGMSPGARWLPPEEHKQVIAELRRSGRPRSPFVRE
jgi:hypothetical protein